MPVQREGFMPVLRDMLDHKSKVLDMHVSGQHSMEWRLNIAGYQYPYTKYEVRAERLWLA
jgi:hypothetical protein